VMRRSLAVSRSDASLSQASMKLALSGRLAVRAAWR
jgi:hypothetical protein